MRLYQLLKPIRSFRARNAINDFVVKGICVHSKSVRPGCVFVAVHGTATNGGDFIAESVAKGARAVFAGPGYAGRIPQGVSLIEVNDCRKLLSQLASEFYRRSSSRMNVIGVTGTNGKTTVTYLIEAIVRAAGGNPAVVGTVNYRFCAKTYPAKNTTPGPVELHKLFNRMRRKGVTHVAMEVSSHALDQDRTADVDFSAAIFTNLTRDHLDYHRAMGTYFAAKAKLFRQLSRDALALINCDDRYGRKLKAVTNARTYTYGIGKGTINATKISMSVAGSTFTLTAFGRKLTIKTALIGRHNVYNILAAAGWALASGITPRTVQRAIRGFTCVPGRMENVPTGKGFTVFVDYAHTDDALTNVITALRQVSVGRIIVVFGCGGNRDKGKRPKMGLAVSAYADYAVVTSDNPRSEPPMEIIRGIVRGIKKDNYRIISDRRTAIREALQMAKKGDIVLVAGKGHEHYQIFADRTVSFDDRKVVEEWAVE